MGNPKGQCNLGLCFLRGLGCRPDLELAYKWISRAIDSWAPIVIQMLLQWIGLDVSKVSGNYQQFRQSRRGGEFGKAFDRIFDEPKKSILAVPPSNR
jgi:hypothetical protein